MILEPRKADIFDVATREADAGLLFMHSGFNVRSATWSFRFLPALAGQCIEEVRAPWRGAAAGTVLSLVPAPAVGTLRSLYLVPNPADAKGLASLEAVAEVTLRGIGALIDAGASNIAMMLVPALDMTMLPPSTSKEMDVRSALATLGALRQMASERNGHVRILLTDLRGSWADVVAAATR